MTSARRLLLVHAHPDDETINNGATMARYIAAGVQVTLLTCTLGEEGEILVPELAQLAADQADQVHRPAPPCEVVGRLGGFGREPLRRSTTGRTGLRRPWWPPFAWVCSFSIPASRRCRARAGRNANDVNVMRGRVLG
ncbi:MAG TPA: PIG-L family deacetylase [Pedococcus sp.]|nr:PIG-L family deacetylase [Pedococcus sp.]